MNIAFLNYILFFIYSTDDRRSVITNLDTHDIEKNLQSINTTTNKYNSDTE